MKFYYIFLSLIFSILGFGQATSSSVPVAGDTFYYKVNNLPFPVPSKVNGVFDFKSLVSTDSSIWTYEKANSPVYPTANLLYSQSDFAGNQIYFNSNNGKIYLVNLGNLPIPPDINISQNLKGSLVYMTYPFNLTTTSNTNDSISIAVPADSALLGVNIDSIVAQMIPVPIPGATFHVDSIFVTLKFNVKLNADQSGKITTPFDSAVDCIRILRKLSITPAINLRVGIYLQGNLITTIKQDVTPFLTGMVDLSFLNQTQHLYYSPKYKSEVLQGTLDSTGTQYNGIYYRQGSFKDTIKPIDTIKPKPVDTIKPKPIDSTHTSIQQNVDAPLQFSWTENTINIFGKKANELIFIQIYDIMGRKKVEKTIRENTLYIEDLEKNQLYIFRYRYKEREGSLKLMH